MDNKDTKQEPSMNNQDAKQSSSRIPFTRLAQVESDSALATTLQEQERAFTMLSTIESESADEEDEEVEYDDENDPDYEFCFPGFDPEGEGELGYLEGEGSNTDIDMEEDEEDEIDPDELTYEELIALGEFMGEEKRGLSVNQIAECLHACKFPPPQKKTGIDRCVICQVEYEEGETLAALPCQHPYHSECISKWLQLRKICPICSQDISSQPRKNIIS